MENKDCSSKIKEGSVAFLAPCGGPVDPMAFQSALLLLAGASKFNIEVKMVGVTDRVMIHTARNVLAKEFLKSECEWSFWYDSDMILESSTIPKMIQFAKANKAKMVTGIYHQRQGEHKPLSMIRMPDKKYADDYSHDIAIFTPEMKSPVKIDATGFGCILVHRSVYESMEFPYFKYFHTTEGVEVSEDFYFCVQAKKLGFDLWALPELQCGHMGERKVVYAKDFKMPENVKQIKLTGMK